MGIFQNFTLSGFIHEINLLQFFIFLTFLHAVFSLKRNQRPHCYLGLVLLLALTTETIWIVFKFLHWSVYTLYSVSFIFYHLLWLMILTRALSNKQLGKMILAGFLSFSLANLFLIEKDNLNYLTFIAGALLYISLFLWHSYQQLQREALNYFTQNEYLLLCIPVIFFFGFSFMFGFRNLPYRNVIVFGHTDLYTFLSYSANIVYYSLANLYIYRERKQATHLHEH